MIIFKTINLAVLLSSSFFITTASIILLRPIAFKIGLTDKPCSRKKHQGEIPLIGGLAIYLCIAYAILTQSAYVLENIAFFSGCTIIVVTGLLDDFKNLSIKARFFAEIVVALIMIKWGGLQITSLGNLFGVGEIQLGIFSILVTVIATVGGINAFNMIDGIDGLAGGISLIIYFLLSILCIIFDHNNNMSQLCVILASATAAFLLFNLPITGRKNASVYLGDTGSMLLGFTICWLIISASQGDNKIISPVSVLWLIGVPLLDMATIMIRRIRKGRSPFAPDREHFHHILPVAGYGIYATLLIILSFSAILGAIGIAGNLLLNAPDWLMFYLFISLFMLYYLGMSYSWKMVKIARYLREAYSDKDRRKKPRRSSLSILPLPFKDRRISAERRSGTDRRYKTTAKETEMVTIQRKKIKIILDKVFARKMGCKSKPGC